MIPPNITTEVPKHGLRSISGGPDLEAHQCWNLAPNVRCASDPVTQITVACRTGKNTSQRNRREPEIFTAFSFWIDLGSCQTLRPNGLELLVLQSNTKNPTLKLAVCRTEFFHKSWFLVFRTGRLFKALWRQKFKSSKFDETPAHVVQWFFLIFAGRIRRNKLPTDSGLLHRLPKATIKLQQHAILLERWNQWFRQPASRESKGMPRKKLGYTIIFGSRLIPKKLDTTIFGSLSTTCMDPAIDLASHEKAAQTTTPSTHHYKTLGSL